MIPVQVVLAASGLLFAVGLFGILTRRNFILLLISVEIVMNSAILNFVAFSSYASGPPLGAVTGQAIAVVLVGLAATEVAVGLAIVLALNRLRGSIDVAKAMQLRF
jgi:NADH:ubiquinone oxidoreductase subunit K